jgi:hypothetical protein
MPLALSIGAIQQQKLDENSGSFIHKSYSTDIITSSSSPPALPGVALPLLRSSTHRALVPLVPLSHLVALQAHVVAAIPWTRNILCGTAQPYPHRFQQTGYWRVAFRQSIPLRWVSKRTDVMRQVDIHLDSRSTASTIWSRRISSLFLRLG